MKFLIIFLTSLTVAFTITIDCNYRTIFLTQNDGYGCDGKDSIDGSPHVLSITGSHQAGKTDIDVEVFRIWNDCELEVIPQKINNFFPNLIALWLNGCKFKEVSSDNFAEYENLLELDLADNGIQYVHEKAFESLKNLKFLFLNDNKIIFVGPNLLQRLSSLMYVTFENNNCISSKLLISDQNEFRNLILDLAIQCPLTIKIAENIFGIEKSKKLIWDLREIVDSGMMTNYDDEIFGNSLEDVKVPVLPQNQQTSKLNLEGINRRVMKNTRQEQEKLKLREEIKKVYT